MSKAAVFLSMGLALMACGDAPSSAAAPLVVDSAGVRIVRHTAQPAWRLTVGLEADLRLGTRADGGDALYRVRGGAFLDGGGVVVANHGSSEILYFSSEGELVHRAGGEGQGPSEFSNILWLQDEGDGSLAVYDAGNIRLAHLDHDGEFLSTQNMNIDPEAEPSDQVMRGPGFPIGVVQEGGVLMIPWAVAVLDGVDGPLPLRGELRKYSEDLSEYQPVDSVRLRTWYEAAQVEGPPVGQILESPLFLFAADREWVAYSEARTHRVTVLHHGRISYVIEEARARQPFTPDSVPEYIASVADSLPAYRELQVDADGRVWVKSPAEDEASPAQWREFSEGGTAVRTLELPASTSVLDAVGDRLLLLERDSLGVETIAIRHIAKLDSR